MPKPIRFPSPVAEMPAMAVFLTVLEREVVPVETCYGTIRMKLGRRGHTVYNAQPEFEDCQRAARARGVPIKEVWAEAMATYRTRGTEAS